MPAEDIFQARRKKTDETLERVRVAFLERLGEDADSAVGSHTTSYVTGSGGRGDMGAASDLDPYVVTLESSAASTMDAASAVIAEALRSAVHDAGLRELDRDGEYVTGQPGTLLPRRSGRPLDQALAGSSRDRRGASAKCCFHRRGVSWSTWAKGWVSMRCSTSTRYV